MSDISKIAAFLEKAKWTKDLAGEHDFDKVTKSIKLADEERMGLLFAGPFGIGKSLLAKAIGRKFAAHWGFEYRYIDLGDPEDAAKLRPDWANIWCEDLHNEVIVLDDVGAEDAYYLNGIRREPVLDFLMARNRRWEKYVGDGNLIEPTDNSRKPFPMLIMATNLNSEQTDDRYSGRFTSRMKNLVVPCHMEGKDKRNWKIAK